MDQRWGWVYQVGIWVFGGMMIVSLFLSWARYLKRWWGREKTIQGYEYEQRKRDAQ